jgi:hypothetical protein
MDCFERCISMQQKAYGYHRPGSMASKYHALTKTGHDLEGKPRANAPICTGWVQPYTIVTAQIASVAFGLDGSILVRRLR